jgi:hypothetical protein
VRPLSRDPVLVNAFGLVLELAYLSSARSIRGVAVRVRGLVGGLVLEIHRASGSQQERWVAALDAAPSKRLW